MAKLTVSEIAFDGLLAGAYKTAGRYNNGKGTQNRRHVIHVKVVATDKSLCGKVNPDNWCNYQDEQPAQDEVCTKCAERLEKLGIAQQDVPLTKP